MTDVVRGDSVFVLSHFPGVRSMARILAMSYGYVTMGPRTPPTSPSRAAGVAYR